MARHPVRMLPYLGAALVLLSCNLGSGLSFGASATATEAAPTEVATSAAAHTGPSGAIADSCVIGTWQIKDIGGFISSVLPSSVTQGGALEFKGTDGSLNLTFAQDGQLSLNAQSFAVHYAMKINPLSLNLDIILNGEESGDFSIAQPGTMVISGVNQSGLTYSVAINGVSSGASAEPLPLFGAQGASQATLSYQCSGNTLEYTPPVSGASAVVFVRSGG